MLQYTQVDDRVLVGKDHQGGNLELVQRQRRGAVDQIHQSGDRARRKREVQNSAWPGVSGRKEKSAPTTVRASKGPNGPEMNFARQSRMAKFGDSSTKAAMSVELFSSATVVANRPPVEMPIRITRSPIRRPIAKASRASSSQFSAVTVANCAGVVRPWAVSRVRKALAPSMLARVSTTGLMSLRLAEKPCRYTIASEVRLCVARSCQRMILA